MVTTGSSAGFMLAFLAAVRAGRPGRHGQPRLSAVPQHPRGARLRAGADRDFRNRAGLRVGETLLAAHRARPLKGVLVASPANPTGTMMRAEALAALIRCAEGEGIAFISDEIYHGLDYAFAGRRRRAHSRSDAIIINSFSKYFCMTGWRIGWMVVPPALVRPIERLQQNLAISVPTLSQIAAEAAFDGRAEMEAIKHGYEENRRILLEGLPKAGLDRFLPVDGAFYLYADVSRFSPTASPSPRACWRRPASRRRQASISTRSTARIHSPLLRRAHART